MPNIKQQPQPDSSDPRPWHWLPGSVTDWEYIDLPVTPKVTPPVRPEDESGEQPVVMLDQQVGNVVDKLQNIEGELHGVISTIIGEGQQVVSTVDREIAKQLGPKVGGALAAAMDVDNALDIQLTDRIDNIGARFADGMQDRPDEIPGAAGNDQLAGDGRGISEKKKQLVNQLIAAGWNRTDAEAVNMVEDLDTLPGRNDWPGNNQWESTRVLVNGREVQKFIPATTPPNGPFGPSDFAFCTGGRTPYKHTSGMVFCVVGGDSTKPKQPPADDASPTPSEPRTIPSPPAPDNSGQCVRVEICNWPDEPKKSEPKSDEPRTHILWQTKAGACYVTKIDASPLDPSDTKIEEGEFTQNWVDKIASQCGKKADKKDDIEGGAGSDAIFQNLQSCITNSPIASLLSIHSVAELGKLMGVDFAAKAKMSYPGIKDWITSPIRSTVEASKIDTANILVKLTSFIDTLINKGQCVGSAAFAETAMEIVANVTSYLTGNSLAWIFQPITYDKNTRCPYLLPSASEALSAYLSDAISEERLKCLATANGFVWDQWTPNIETGRAKHSPLDLVQLYRRNWLDHSELSKRLRQIGYTRPIDTDEIIEVTRPIPGPEDIVRFMLRDVVSPKVVERFRLDDNFAENFQGKLKQYAEYQGVDEEQMRMYWRAHWSIPSPTQLYEMWRRLRHDPKEGGEAKLLDDIKTALVQQDILPFWQDRLIKLATLPLNRTDAKRAYRINELDDNGLLEAFWAGGYNDEDAQKLLRFAKKEKRLSFARHDSVQKFARGLITRDQFSELLAFEGAEQVDIEYAIKRAKLIAQSRSREKCAAAVKRRYFLAEYDFQDMLQRLYDLGIDPDIAASIATANQCERANRGKLLPIRTLTRYYRQHIITAPEFARRAVTLGYQIDDALLMLEEQDAMLDEQKRKKGLADAKDQARKQAEANRKAEAAQAKMQKEINAQRGQMEKEMAKVERAQNAKRVQTEKQAKQSAAALKAARTLAAEREDKIFDMAANQVKVSGGSLGDNIRTARACFNSLRLSGKNPDSVLAIGVAASKVKSNDTPDKFCRAWQEGVDQSVGLGSEVIAPNGAG